MVDSSFSRDKGGSGAALPKVFIEALAPVERVQAASSIP